MYVYSMYVVCAAGEAHTQEIKRRRAKQEQRNDDNTIEHIPFDHLFVIFDF